MLRLNRLRMLCAGCRPSRRKPAESRRRFYSPGYRKTQAIPSDSAYFSLPGGCLPSCHGPACRHRRKVKSVHDDTVCPSLIFQLWTFSVALCESSVRGRLRPFSVLKKPVAAPDTDCESGGIVVSASCPTGQVRAVPIPALYSTRRPQAASDGGCTRATEQDLFGTVGAYGPCPGHPRFTANERVAGTRPAMT